MASCKKIVRTDTRVCVGSLNRRITIQTRSIATATAGSVDYNEDFALEKIVWAMIKTIKGVAIFDDTNVARDVSHNIYIRYDKELNMTAERWITLPTKDGDALNKVDILKVQDLDDNQRFHLLTCAIRGKSDQLSNFA